MGALSVRGRVSTEWLPLAIPLALAAAVFAHAVAFPFVNWDDPSHFSDNPLAVHPLARGVRGLLLTREIGYPAPLLLLSFALDRVVWGLRPGPYHAEEILLHLADVCMLFRLARRLRLSPMEACAVATLLAVHPLVVEPVCWVTGRKDLLSTAMVFGASLLAMGNPARDAPSPAWRWVVADVLLALAVLVLPRAVVAPILLVILVHAVRPDWSLRGMALRVAPAFAVTLPVVVVGARQIAELGALPPPRGVSQFVADVAGAWALQLWHFIFPVDLLPYYWREPGDPSIAGMAVAAIAACAALAAVAVRAPRGSPIRAGAMLALVAYAPVSCVFVIRRWTADSYMYVPIAAIGLTVVPAIARGWPATLSRFGRYAATVLVVLLAFLSFTASSRWSSSTKLWTGSIARYPNEPLAYEHEALGLATDRRVEEANALFIQIAERFPDWEDTLDDEVRAYAAAGQPERAAAVLAHGIRLGSPACVRMYWMWLLESPSPPDRSQRELVALAFVKGFDAMKVGLDAVALRRVGEILHELQLEDLATQVSTYLESAHGGARQ
jgi:protein O-mannosyl-transferase